jgi:alkylhydroperoxidase/carboxymuconolactone decarboxylase family protein YurZ
MAQIPDASKAVGQAYPGVMSAYEQLAAAAHDAGPLDERTRRLVKLAMAAGAKLEGAVRSHVSQARDAGISDAEIDHVFLLAITTIGLPSAVASRTWAREANPGERS